MSFLSSAPHVHHHHGSWLDRLGGSLALICAVHCLLTPMLVVCPINCFDLLGKWKFSLMDAWIGCPAHCIIHVSWLPEASRPLDYWAGNSWHILSHYWCDLRICSWAQLSHPLRGPSFSSFFQFFSTWVGVFFYHFGWWISCLCTYQKLPIV